MMIENLVICEGVEVSRKAMLRLVETGVSVIFLDSCGRARCRLSAPMRNTPELRIRQYRAWEDPELRLTVARTLAEGKIRNARNLIQDYRKNYANPELKRAVVEIDRILGRLSHAQSSAELMGFEGSAARSYWNAFGVLLRPDFIQWNGRNRRPPRDPANAALSYGYGILLNRTLALIEASGLDPWVGFLHEASGRHPSLALDLMEPLRPTVVDRLVLALFNREQLRQEHFHRPNPFGEAVYLNGEGRRLLLEEMENRMCRYEPEVFGGESSSLNTLLKMIEQFRKCSLAEDLSSYSPASTHATPL